MSGKCQESKMISLYGEAWPLGRIDSIDFAFLSDQINEHVLSLRLIPSLASGITHELTENDPGGSSCLIVSNHLGARSGLRKRSRQVIIGL
eukprot:scaffold5388_cov151-Skeletonema_dohrnii-CCMP3373.AAC.3